MGMSHVQLLLQLAKYRVQSYWCKVIASQGFPDFKVDIALQC
jgi:hypothetical protein